MFKNMLVCLVCCLTYVDAMGADIFGLKKGMTIEEIRALGFGTIIDTMGLDNDYFGVVNPKMPKNANNVSFIISPKDGLLWVSFKWSTYKGKNSVDTLKRKYREIRDILIRTYGKEGFGMMEKPGEWIHDMADQLAVAKSPHRELWRKSDFDADNKWQLEKLRLELSTEIAKHLVLEYHFQDYWQYMTAKFEARRAKYEAKKAKEAEASPF